MKDRMKGFAIALMCTGALCFSVRASEASGPASNVWLDVIEESTQARISVTVPLSYGFVVIGSVESSDTVPVSTANGNLLLPNVQVKVTNTSVALPLPAGNDAAYELQFISEESLPIRNYSTDIREENAESAPPIREGLPVEVKPYIISLPVDDNLLSISAHHWKPSLVDPTWDGTSATENDAKLDFKQFRIILDGLPFSKPGTKSISTILSNGDERIKTWSVIWLENEAEFALDAPPDVPTNGYTAAGTARIPSEKYFSVQVQVGGIQNQYKQVEESVKVAGIYWDVIPGTLPATEP